MRRSASRVVALLCGATAMLAACATAPPAGDAAAPDPADWASVLDAARGQTLDWYMFTGDEAINGVVEGHVAPRLEREFGVTLNVVPVADTADAVNKVLAERQAGRAGSGTVDAIWINGENFATGKQADLWSCGYPEALPNAQYVDLTAPAVATDFGVPVDGCEAAWHQANSALVYDSGRLTPADVASLTALEDWAGANPGLFTYPAPPDFTGSMAVRTFLYDTAGDPAALAGTSFDAARFAPLADRLWGRLDALEPALWRGGETYLVSTVAAAVLGVAAALLVRSLGRARPAFATLLQVTLPLPHAVAALAMILLLSQSGALSRVAATFGWIEGPVDFPALTQDAFGWGVIASYVWKEAPFVAVVVLAALSSGVAELEDAARALGATAWQRLRHVLAPVLAPAVAAAAVLVFAFTLGSYEVPFLLGRPFPATLPVVAYQQFRDPDLAARPLAMAIAVLTALLVGAGAVAYLALSERLRR